MGGKKKEQMKQQILTHTEKLQEKLNLRLLLDNPAFLETEFETSENILWVENITVTAITWPAPKSKASKLFAGIRNTLSDVGKWLNQQIHRFV